MGRPALNERPAAAPRFTVFDFRLVGLTTATIDDEGRTFASDIPGETAKPLADLLNAADVLAKGARFRPGVPNAEFIAGIVAKAMEGSIDFESFAEARRG